jgi:hypothetical protein
MEDAVLWRQTALNAYVRRRMQQFFQHRSSADAKKRWNEAMPRDAYW